MATQWPHTRRTPLCEGALSQGGADCHLGIVGKGIGLPLQKLLEATQRALVFVAREVPGERRENEGRSEDEEQIRDANAHASGAP